MQAWAGHRPGHYDLVHSHYWLSGHVGWLAAERWGAPLVHAMHTMAKVKNAALADGDTPEPAARVIGETQIVAGRRPAHRQHRGGGGRTGPPLRRGRRQGRRRPPRGEPRPLLSRRTAAPRPGPGWASRRTPSSRSSPAVSSRSRPPTSCCVRSAVLLDAGPFAALADRGAGGRRAVSGSGLARPEGLHKLAARLGIADVVRFRPPVAQDQLADWFRAASVLVMPSYNESFGLVAIEAQAVGTPVVAAEVGGLPVAVREGSTGFLVQGHEPARYAEALRRFVDAPQLVYRMGDAATRHAQSFGWDTAASATADVYAAAMHEHRRRVRSHHG